MKVKFNLRGILGFGLGLGFIFIGIDHFIHTSWYQPIVPDILPAPKFWVLLSGLFEASLGLLLIIPRTRALASFGIAWMLVALYWANFNMWYNDIPLNETQYDSVFHLFRFVIQLILIFTIAWIGEITPFKGQERNIKKMDIFSGTITCCGFESGDRIVISDWKKSPFGSFTDVMWATSEGKRILIAPNTQISDYVQSLYTFEEVLIEEINIAHRLQEMTLSSESLTVECKWNKGWSIPFSRSLFFIATVELLFARIFWGTRTYGRSKNNRKQWYAVDRVSKITEAKATINGKDAGKKATKSEQCKFGFREPPKNPSSVAVRNHIQKQSE